MRKNTMQCSKGFALGFVISAMMFAVVWIAKMKHCTKHKASRFIKIISNVLSTASYFLK